MNRLNKELRVTREVKHAAADAIEDYMVYTNIGSSGDIDEKPYEWVESITATTSAAKKAENAIEQSIQKEKEAEQKKKGKKK